jgi:hypothetical protein
MIAYCNSWEEAAILAQKTTSAGYIGLHIRLTAKDIKHLLSGGYIYRTCNSEYGVVIEAKLSPVEKNSEGE